MININSEENQTLLFLKLTVAACLMYGFSSGVRSVYGIMLNAVAIGTGISYEAASLAVAVGQLSSGLSQPLFGILALKKSNVFVLELSLLMMALGFCAIPFCTGGGQLILAWGLLLSCGTGAAAFGIVMSAVTSRLGESRGTTASGFVNASSGVGGILLPPLIQTLFMSFGLGTTMFTLAAVVLCLFPFSLWLRAPARTPDSGIPEGRQDAGVMSLLKRAAHNKNYLFLTLAFFTCGFHMAIIETHFFSQILSYGIAGSTAALAFSAYGAAAIMGALASGFLCSRFRMKTVLGLLYGSRVLIAAAFLLLPMSVPMAFILSVMLGLTGNSTVVPTAGLTGKFFGADSMGTLFGLAFCVHQIGSFFSAWLGGVCVALTGGYAPMWMAASALSLAAVLLSFAVNDNMDEA